MIFKRTVLIVSPEPWNYVFVSKHHYAIELAKKGNFVFFLNPPSLVKEITLKVSEYSGISVIDYAITVKGQRFLPGFLRRWIDLWTLEKLEQAVGSKFDIIWNFENSRFYDFRFASKKVLKIYHQVDLNQDFHPRIAAKTADICFCTTDFIKGKLELFTERVYKIPHGFSGNFSISALNILNGMGAVQVKPTAPVKAYYVGNLDIPYLNLDTLELLIKDNPRVQFVFVGPYSPDKQFYRQLSLYTNVLIKGPVKAHLIQNLLDEADILLLIYKSEEYLEQLASPHKMMEYLASGKVVVASYTDEYKDKRDLLLMADRNEEIPGLFRKAIENLSVLNSGERLQQRIAFARAHTYEKQLQRIEDYIKQAQH